MAVSEDDIRNDQIERDSLQKAVSEVETALTVSTPGTRLILENFLHNAKGRLGALEKKIHEAEREKDQEARNEVVVAALAQKETALNEKEKEQYSGFLKEDFFTKKDFARLDEFYAHTWDRLSEGGKEQMSQRVWEGVRRHECKFTDLPKDVQEKEERRAYKLLTVTPNQATNLAKIPQNDKAAFVHAYESGNREDAGKILDRDSFKENMFRKGDSPPIGHTVVTADSVAVVAQTKKSATAQQGDNLKSMPDSLNNVDLSGISLGAMKPGDNPAQGAVANLQEVQAVPRVSADLFCRRELLP